MWFKRFPPDAPVAIWLILLTYSVLSRTIRRVLSISSSKSCKCRQWYNIFSSLFLLGETNTHVLTFDVCMRMSSLASWTPWLTLTVAISFKIWESTDSSRIFSPRKSTESCRYLSQFWIIFLCNKCAGSWNSFIRSTRTAWTFKPFRPFDPALGDRVSCTMTPIMTPLTSRTPWTQPLIPYTTAASYPYPLNQTT